MQPTGHEHRAHYRVAALIGALVVGACPAPAAAQHDAEGPQRDPATRLLESGQAALEAGRFEEARDLLRRSLALRGTVDATLSLGLALRGAGEPLEARRTLQRLLQGELGALDEDRRREVQRELAEAASEIATLEVRVRGPERARVQVDGEMAGIAGPGPLEVPSDPGARVVAAEARGFVTARQTVTAEAGTVTQVALELLPDRSAGGEDDESSGSALPWIIGAISIVVVGALVAGIVFGLTGSEDPPPDPMM